jgi:S-DNA-T family DNA segregation ATPase FtsK/SpoIIIE
MMLPEYSGSESEGTEPGEVDLSKRDPMFEEAARVVVANQSGSTSLIQRRFSIGYNRAGRIIDQLEAAGVVGPFEGSKARQVLVQDEYELEKIFDSIR